MPRCKNCNKKFEQYEFNNKYCKDLDCQTAKAMYKLNKIKKEKEKKDKARLKEIKYSLKTLSDHLRELQVIFNKYIRLRDNNNLCISCQKIPKKKNAGHYRSVGGCPSLRFEPLNCHLQCEYCNTYKHGNLIEYRKNLIKKIGVEKVEWLEKEHPPKNYSIPEIIILKEKYKEKIKKLEKLN